MGNAAASVPYKGFGIFSQLPAEEGRALAHPVPGWCDQRLRKPPSEGFVSQTCIIDTKRTNDDFRVTIQTTPVPLRGTSPPDLRGAQKRPISRARFNGLQGSNSVPIQRSAAFLFAPFQGHGSQLRVGAHLRSVLNHGSPLRPKTGSQSSSFPSRTVCWERGAVTSLLASFCRETRELTPDNVLACFSAVRLPSPQRGEGFGGEGAGTHYRFPNSSRRALPDAEKQAHTVTAEESPSPPGPSPALGRGEPKLLA
jgi:hypothetical protein